MFVYELGYVYISNKPYHTSLSTAGCDELISCLSGSGPQTVSVTAEVTAQQLLTGSSEYRLQLTTLFLRTVSRLCA